MPDVIPCPQFGVPAEVIQRFWLDPTDGPIQHFQTICLSKHWLMPRAETVHQQGPATRSPRGGAAELLGPGGVGGGRQHRR
jgi:hypothetical protein